MVAVPVYGEDSQRVALVSLQVLASVALGTLVDVAFFCADQEHVLDLRVEVETESTGEPTEHTLVLLFGFDLV